MQDKYALLTLNLCRWLLIIKRKKVTGRNLNFYGKKQSNFNLPKTKTYATNKKATRTGYGRFSVSFCNNNYCFCNRLIAPMND